MDILLPGFVPPGLFTRAGGRYVRHGHVLDPGNLTWILKTMEALNKKNICFLKSHIFF